MLKVPNEKKNAFVRLTITCGTPHGEQLLRKTSTMNYTEK